LVAESYTVQIKIHHQTTVQLEMHLEKLLKKNTLDTAIEPRLFS